MDGERHDVGHVAEEPVQGITSFEDAHFAAVPDAVLREQAAELMGGVSLIAQVAVTGFQKPDLLGGFHAPEPGLDVHGPSSREPFAIRRSMPAKRLSVIPALARPIHE